MKTFVVCGSHRAREKLVRLLGFKPREYFSLHHGYHLSEVPEASLAEVLKITGVRKGKWREGFMKCWSQAVEFDPIEKGA